MEESEIYNISKAATLSNCGIYRYTLHRRIPSVLRWVKPVLFVMLNPSIADAFIDDPTIRRCVGFAKSWGCTELTVVNLFALRATDPSELEKAADPIGPENDVHLKEQIEKHSLVGLTVVAWGSKNIAKERVKQLMSLFSNVKCLGMTKDGSPKHPLYLKNESELISWPKL
jgi:hypothetical protein